MVMSDIEYKTAVYYADEDFVLKVELYNDTPLIHHQMHKATKDILDRVMQKWAEVKALAWADGYEAIYTYTQDPRMFRIFGATKVPGKFNLMGKSYEVGKWELN